MNSVPIDQSLPSSLRAGDALSWSMQTSLAVGTGLFYVLTGVINNVPARILIGSGTAVAVLADQSVAFTLGSTATAAWVPGSYQWLLFAVDSNGNRTEMASGNIDILADPAALPADPRSFNEKLLDQVKALLLGKALDDVSMYKIGTREITKIPLPELQKWYAQAESAVRNERRRRKGLPQRSMPVQFGGF